MPVSDDDGWDEADGWNVAACPRSGVIRRHVHARYSTNPHPVKWELANERDLPPASSHLSN